MGESPPYLSRNCSILRKRIERLRPIYLTAPEIFSFSSLAGLCCLGSVCEKHLCVSCCYDTAMLLLNEDVERICALGYDEQFFAKKDSDGFKVLQNSEARRCVFHDGKRCTIYENRPKGCKLYPIILDENSMSAMRDKLCPHRKEFPLSQKEKKELWHVYPLLLEERLEKIQQE